MDGKNNGVSFTFGSSVSFPGFCLWKICILRNRHVFNSLRSTWLRQFGHIEQKWARVTEFYFMCTLVESFSNFKLKPLSWLLLPVSAPFPPNKKRKSYAHTHMYEQLKSYFSPFCLCFHIFHPSFSKHEISTVLNF